MQLESDLWGLNEEKSKKYNVAKHTVLIWWFFFAGSETTHVFTTVVKKTPAIDIF